MTIFDAIILGVVEGVTEFLPISSTGHLILTSKFLNILESDQTKAFEVIIQGGAILAVLWHFRKFFTMQVKGIISKNADSISLLRDVLLAFLPSAIVGLAL